MKEMTYLDKSKDASMILDKGIYKNYEYIIVNRYSHPCAYVCIDEENIFYDTHYDDIPIECHNGMTFADDVLHNLLDYSEKYECDVLTTIRRDWILGWDYSHFGDYNIYLQQGKKWTTQEIKQEIKQVINQIIKEDITYKLIEVIKEEITMATYESEEEISPFKDASDIHDFSLDLEINGEFVEDSDELYEEVKAILDENGEDIVEEINIFIDDECKSYYGDPAFASASDYWHYILG